MAGDYFFIFTFIDRFTNNLLAMKCINIALIAIVLGFASCDKDENETPLPPVDPVESNVHTFVYDKVFTARDINCYAGPEGEKKTVTEEELYADYDVWNPQRPSMDSLIIDLDVDTAFCISEYLRVNYKIDCRNDTVFGYFIGNGEEFFMGTLNEDKTSFTLYMHYYMWRTMPRPEKELYGAYKFAKGSGYGKMDYSDNFFENNFASPSEMTIDGDFVLWANYEYNFRKE